MDVLFNRAAYKVIQGNLRERYLRIGHLRIKMSACILLRARCPLGLGVYLSAGLCARRLRLLAIYSRDVRPMRKVGYVKGEDNLLGESQLSSNPWCFHRHLPRLPLFAAQPA